MNKLHWNFEVYSDWLELHIELVKFADYRRDPLTNLADYIDLYPQTDLLARYIEPYLDYVNSVSYSPAPKIKKLWEKQCPLQSADEGYMPTEVDIVAPASLFKELHDRLLEFDEQPRYSICI